MQTTFFKFSSILFISTLLAACGAERDTPFNPSGGTSSSSSIPIGATVTMTEIYESEAPQPSLVETASKQIVIIRTQDEFDYFWDTYANGQTFNEIDFELGQVILLDLGNIGANCTQLLTYRSNKANEFSDNTVRVVFSYRDTRNNSSNSSAANSSYSESSCANAENKRPFYFYYVESRKKIVVEEQVIY
jgi:hypothetical protein